MSFKNLVKKILFYGGYYHLRGSLERREEKRLLILMYHDLTEDHETVSGSSVCRERPTRSQFKAHLKSLKDVCRVVSLEQAVDELKSEGDLKEDSAAITFDDGYASVYTVAFQLLREYNFPATVYLTTGWIDGAVEPWWERLTDMVNKCDLTEIDFSVARKQIGDSLTEKLHNLAFARKSGNDFLEEIESGLRQKCDDEIQEILAGLETLMFPGMQYNCEQPVALSWEQIGEMAEHGINFGSHTCSHPNLSHADEGQIEKEVGESKRIIEEHLDRRVQGFAYPYGTDLAGYGKAVPVLKRYEFDYACTAYPGNNYKSSNLFLLRRTSLPLTESTALLGRSLRLGFIEEIEDPGLLQTN